MNEPQKMTVEELLQNLSNNPEQPALEKYKYDIAKEIESFTKRPEKKFIELYLIRQEFKYNEKKSEVGHELDEYDYLGNKIEEREIDDDNIQYVYDKDIYIPIQIGIAINDIKYNKYLIRVHIFLSMDNYIGDYWITGINISMYDYNIRFESGHPKTIIYDTIHCPDVLESISREIYLFKKLKYILDTLNK